MFSCHLLTASLSSLVYLVKHMVHVCGLSHSSRSLNCIFKLATSDTVHRLQFEALHATCRLRFCCMQTLMRSTSKGSTSCFGITGRLEVLHSQCKAHILPGLLEAKAACLQVEAETSLPIVLSCLRSKLPAQKSGHLSWET